LIFIGEIGQFIIKFLTSLAEPRRSALCPLLAQSSRSRACLLLTAKRTCHSGGLWSPFDPGCVKTQKSKRGEE
jgi:hypothetical protein